MVTIGTLLADPKYPEKLIIQKLFCAFTACSREDLRRKMDENIDEDLHKKITEAYIVYVRDKKPLEYILGYVEFFGNKFIVNDATLIPRPETEYMINSVTEFINEQLTTNSEKGRKNILLDIGTGCGVLGISVLLQNPDYFSEAVFTDYFTDALEVAKKNYQGLITNYQGKVEFLHADLLDFLIRGNSELSDKNVVLVANLPYIPEAAFEQNSGDNVKKREPKPAFVGGEDGLDYYRKMLDQIFSLKPKKLVMFLEMMTWQVDILRQEFDEHFIFEEVKTFHFNIRIVKAYLK